MDHQHNNLFRGLLRLGKIFAHQYLAGFNPFTATLSSPCVHTRLLTVEERRLQQSKSEAAELRYQLQRSQRQESTKKLGRIICLSVFHMGVQELTSKIDKQKQVNKELQADCNKHASDVIRLHSKIQKLEIGMHNGYQHLIRATNERDQMFAMLQMEKRKTEAIENQRMIAISSLRNRSHSDQRRLEVEIERLQKEIERQKNKRDEADTYIMELREDITRLEGTVLRLEQNDALSHVSQRLTGFISDISEIANVRPAELLTVDDKLTEIRVCVKDMVEEIKRRRRDFEGLREKVFALEDEKEAWMLSQSDDDQEHRLQRSLFETNQQVSNLRGGHQGSGAPGNSSPGMSAPPGFPPLRH